MTSASSQLFFLSFLSAAVFYRSVSLIFLLSSALLPFFLFGISVSLLSALCCSLSSCGFTSFRSFLSRGALPWVLFPFLYFLYPLSVRKSHSSGLSGMYRRVWLSSRLFGFAALLSTLLLVMSRIYKKLFCIL